MYRMAVLMSVGSRVRNFRVRHGSWLLVHHHRVGGVNTATAWVVLGGGLWETFRGGNIELCSSKDVKHSLGHNVYAKDISVSHFPGNFCEIRKGGQVNCVQRRISPSKVSVVFNIRKVRVRRINVYNELSGCQEVGASTRPN